MQCPGDVVEVSTEQGFVLACSESWNLAPWWGLSIEDSFTLAAAISALWAVAWVWRQLQRVA